jgi:hypothetical protein
MAFGKDQGHLGSIPAYGRSGNFVQQAKTQARRPPRRGGGGQFYWKGCYRAPDNVHDVVRLIPGRYSVSLTHDGENIVTEELPYVPFREHHDGQRGSICSAGPLWTNKKMAQPCPPCTIFWEDVRERQAKKARGDTTKGPNRMSCRDQFAFNVFDYGLYFEMPDVDRNGQMRINQKTQQPFMHWEKGNPNDPRYSGRPWKHGHLSAWPMAQTYKDMLVTRAKDIGKSCVNCKTLNSIESTMRVCGNPQCGQYIYDPNNCTLTNEQREQIDDYPYTCPHCQQTSYTNELLQCLACQNPVRASIFDVDLEVSRMGTKGQQTYLIIHNYSEPRPIQIADPEVLKTIQPLDLLKKFAPTTPEAAAKLFNMIGQPHAAPPPPMGMMPPMPVVPMAPMPMQQPMMGQSPMAQPSYAPQPAPQGAVATAQQAAGFMPPAVPYGQPGPGGYQQG